MSVALYLAGAAAAVLVLALVVSVVTLLRVRALGAEVARLRKDLAIADCSGHREGCECWRCEELRRGPDALAGFRSRRADPAECPHPEGDREPISGDGWLCGDCGELVPGPGECW